ncbi:hypothetical protein [Salinisphaera sp. T5B8]|uniref:hypothetical protein n=1 Tax=Salinisphaera sp. T5B8 TaxID=1304154 RepID=UPI003342E012
MSDEDEKENTRTQGSADSAKNGSAEADDRNDGASQSKISSPGELESAIEKLKRDKPEQVTEIMAMMGQGPMPNPIHQKMNESHVTQVLDLAANHDEREYNLHKQREGNKQSDATSNRRYGFAALLVGVVLFAYILFLFKNQPDILVPIITGLGGVLGGFLGGWGIGRRHE